MHLLLSAADAMRFCHFQPHQVLLPLLDSDLFDVALGCAEGNLKARVPEVGYGDEPNSPDSPGPWKHLKLQQ